jgi:hypothetical protein
MDSLTVTIVGGVVVVVIGLFIEYGIFQKRKKNIGENLSLNSDTQINPQLTDNTRPLLSDVSSKSTGDLPWPKAINKAVAEFSSLHTGKRVEVHSTDAGANSASLFIVVHGSSQATTKYYSLIVNKSGEIVSITQSR